MSRARQISIVIALILANYLVFSNLGVMLFTMGSTAVSRPATRTPRPTFTPLPPTETATPTMTPIPPPTNTPLPTNTPIPTDTPNPNITPRANTTPAPASPQRPIVIPNPSAIPTGPANPVVYPFRYTVRAGDSLSVLADRFLVPRAKIMAANGLTNPDRIFIGQVLVIPDPNQ
jgi:LysM repeat protein